MFKSDINQQFKSDIKIILRARRILSGSF